MRWCRAVSYTHLDAAPSRQENKGPHLIFNDVDVTVTGTPPNTADGGGISVTGNSKVSVSLGQWGGSVYVGAGSTLSTTFSNQIKSMEAEAVSYTHLRRRPFPFHHG